MPTVGIVLFGLKLPTDLDNWLTFAWVFVLGVTGRSLPRTARSAPAVMNLPYL